jgi:uncharacterized protein YicC (UPF0701 family)
MSQSREISRLTKDLGRASELRKAATDAIRQTTKSMLAACATVRGELGREYGAQTRKFLASLAKDVAAYRRAMAHQIAKTKKNVAADRQATMRQITRWTGARSEASDMMHRDLERQATSIMNKTAELRSEFSDAHRNMAKQQEAALKSGHRKLHAGTARVVNAMHADRMKAQGIWANFRQGGAA